MQIFRYPLDDSSLSLSSFFCWIHNFLFIDLNLQFILIVDIPDLLKNNGISLTTFSLLFTLTQNLKHKLVLTWKWTLCPVVPSLPPSSLFLWGWSLYFTTLFRWVPSFWRDSLRMDYPFFVSVFSMSSYSFYVNGSTLDQSRWISEVSTDSETSFTWKRHVKVEWQMDLRRERG